MPQITLKFSANTKNLISNSVLESAFLKLNEIFKETIPDIDIKSCNSGVIFEDYSFLSEGNSKEAKCYYELQWMENPKRVPLKPELASKIMTLLETVFVPLLAEHSLVCTPRVRIGDLGKRDQDYFISKLVV